MDQIDEYTIIITAADASVVDVVVVVVDVDAVVTIAIELIVV